MQIQGLHFITETTWPSIFQSWREREGVREDWQQSAKNKGWQSWDEWRDAWVRNFGAQERKWLRYEILDPLTTVPSFRVGPSQSWQKHFPKTESLTHTFAELVERVSYEQNDKVKSMLENFPDSTEFIGIYLPNKTIMIIEGHHRATALALANKQGETILFNKLPTIALTVFEEGEEGLLESMLERGSNKADQSFLRPA